MREDTLILCLGNPIVRNDQVGLLVGQRLLQEVPGVAVRTFTGSPLALICEVESCARLILIDAVCTRSRPAGSVILFTEKDLCRWQGDLFPHGLNLAAALAVGRCLGARLPPWIRLIGIEVGAIEEFAETPGPEIVGRIDAVIAQTLSQVRELLAECAQGGELA